MFGDELLDNEVVLLSGDREMLLLQSTLVLASNSDLDRGYKSHLEWSEARIRKLRSSSPVDGNGDEASTFFCFAPENADKLSQILLSITSLRLPKSQSWVIRNVKVPFVALWERYVDAPEQRRLCQITADLAAKTCAPAPASPMRRCCCVLSQASSSATGAELRTEAEHAVFPLQQWY
eukprot:jgi/Tetstr1/460230/TSEL_005545.t1